LQSNISGICRRLGLVIAAPSFVGAMNVPKP